MTYLFVMIVSVVGITTVVVLRGILRSRNIRRIARTVRQHYQAIESRGMKWAPDTLTRDIPKSPRVRAIELQQVRTLLRQSEKSIASNNPNEAERALIQALTIQPNEKEVQFQLAKVYLISKREQKAEALYRSLISEEEDAALLANLGLACYRQQKYVEACKAYQQALNLDPQNPHRCEDLGRACVAAKRFEEAAPLIAKAIEANPRKIDLLHLLAQCYLQTGDQQSAEVVYMRINKLDPRDENVKAKLKEFRRRTAA